MSTEVEVPKEVPVLDLTDEQAAAIERFYEDYTKDHSHLQPSAEAIISGRYPNPNKARCEEARVGSGRHPDMLSLYGEEIPFDEAYRTSTKHTYSSGVHAAGYRLTISYHDASGGAYIRLKVKREEYV